MNRLKARGAIDDNWEETQRLFQELKSTGRCVAHLYDEHEGPDLAMADVTFRLDEQRGLIRIWDDHDPRGPFDPLDRPNSGWIGSWHFEAGHFVLCLENHRRPFFKTKNIAKARKISHDLVGLSSEDRHRFLGHNSLWWWQ